MQTTSTSLDEPKAKSNAWTIDATHSHVGFSVRHNTDPPVGFEETDTLTTINLVYEIK